ncbi:hypothetical protein BD311DRAFT_265948 [Dichomitus squalens]|uniref:Uncharacterized protein n=1 Tax=Dichomitus squalens TaxID=114155 RepID=A0A4Q9MTJ9_9APHY|nr:hypothetical protein BD311DRAFT_265948 [Dichomitus squalens]
MPLFRASLPLSTDVSRPCPPPLARSVLRRPISSTSILRGLPLVPEAKAASPSRRRHQSGFTHRQGPSAASRVLLTPLVAIPVDARCTRALAKPCTLCEVCDRAACRGRSTPRASCSLVAQDWLPICLPSGCAPSVLPVLARPV